MGITGPFPHPFREILEISTLNTPIKKQAIYDIYL
jgi:hypothetical protein